MQKDLSNIDGCFLHDKLYNYTLAFIPKSQVISIKEFQELTNDLCLICDNNWKPSLTQKKESITPKHIKHLIDMTFISWDIFATKLESENNAWAAMIKKYSYMFLFMNNPKMKQTYEALKLETFNLNES